MALKKPTFEQEPAVATATAEHEETTVNLKAEPETLNETKTMTTEAATQTTATAHVEAAAQSAAKEVIVRASNTAVAVADAAAKAKEFQREVTAMKGASDFSYGNYRVFKGNNGEIAESSGEQDSLGRWAKVRMLSWDDHHEVSPGESGAGTKDFVAYSKDGKTIDSVIGEELKSWVGSPVSEYVDYLKKEEEFANTKTRRFIDIAAALMATDSGDGPIGKVIQITLSESSIPAFSRYQQDLQDTARCVAMGLPGFSLPDDPFTFFFIREVASKGTNKWTKLRIESSLPAKL
jgi:hypothetical protein